MAEADLHGAADLLHEGDRLWPDRSARSISKGREDKGGNTLASPSPTPLIANYCHPLADSSWELGAWKCSLQGQPTFDTAEQKQGR